MTKIDKKGFEFWSGFRGVILRTTYKHLKIVILVGVPYQRSDHTILCQLCMANAHLV
jgi:hypothetical protein